MLDKCTHKAMSVLMGEYSPADIADHLADYAEKIGGISVWEMDANMLVWAAEIVYPQGAIGLLLRMDELYG